MATTGDEGTYVDFYDLLNALDWSNEQLVEKAKKMSKLSLEHRIIFMQFENHIKNGTKKPERPTTHD